MRISYKAIFLFLLLCIFAYAVPILLHFPMIGTVHGVENEYLTVNGITYERCDLFADRGHYLGSVSNGREKMRVFSCSDETLLRVLWEWEGYTYQRIE